MNAPPWPSDPSIGEWFANWVWSGFQWVASPTTGLRLITQTFPGNGVYMPSPGLVSLVVECIGGGGGGGGASAVGNYVVAGGGGGSGGYSRSMIPAALVRGGVTVTVGDLGAGGGANGRGNAGGATSLGALCMANGGSGGGPSGGAGGVGGAAGIGNVVFPGASGLNGNYQYFPSLVSMSAAGGTGGWVFGGSVNTTADAPSEANGANALPNTGAGGSGGVINQTPAGSIVGGGNGGSGICIVTEYCWGDRDDVKQWSPPLNVNLNWPRPPFPPGGPWPPGWLPPPGPWPRSEDDP